MSNPTYVAFGPNDTFVNLNGDNISWSSRLPKNLWNKLNGRYGENQKQNNSPLKVIDIGEDDNENETYAMFMQDGNWWISHPMLAQVLENDGIRGDQVDFVSLGPNSYIVRAKARIFWSNIPNRAAELINSRTQHSSLIWAALGANDAWFLKFEDGASYWGGDIPRDLSKSLSGDKTCEKLFLSAFNSHYYIEFSNGTEWVASQSFTNNIEACAYLDPHPILYTHSSIKDRFQCGKSIYDVVNDLENGNIGPQDIPAIKVFTYLGSQYSVDNRRLWVFTKAQVKEVPIIWTKPSEQMKRKLRGQGFDGTTINVRRGYQSSDDDDSDSSSY